jgi:hypothetical protein
VLCQLIWYATLGFPETLENLEVPPVAKTAKSTKHSNFDVSRKVFLLRKGVSRS